MMPQNNWLASYPKVEKWEYCVVKVWQKQASCSEVLHFLGLTRAVLLDAHDRLMSFHKPSDSLSLEVNKLPAEILKGLKC